MKNLLSNFQHNLLKGIIFTIIVFASSINSSAQTQGKWESYLTALPKNLELSEPSPQRYRVTSDYYNGDVYGNFFDKTRVMGEYTRGLKDGTVKWNKVSIAQGKTRDGGYEKAMPQPYMEDFTYFPSDKLIEAEAFTTFPPNSFHTKNLVWDVLGIEGFAWHYFDSLQLNVPFKAAAFNGEIQLTGEGTFENRNVLLTWTGISRMNGDVCALIDYRTFDNPLTIKNDYIDIKGRSHYWGTIWVSLADKQIEHAVLYEDAVMEMKFAGQENMQLVDVTREIVFEKIVD